MTNPFWTMRPTIACLIISCGVVSAVAPGREVPFEIGGKVVLVDCKVNGRGPFKFIIDSGASETVIVPPLAKELGIAREGQIFSTRTTGWVDSVEVGGSSVGRMPVYVFDPPQALPLRLDKGINYQGLLGYTFLARFVTVLDYGRRRVKFMPIARVSRHVPAVPPGDDSSAHHVGFSLRNNLIHAKGRVNGKGPVTFLVDTGSAEVLLLPSTAKSLKIRATRAPGFRDVGFTELREVSLGGAKVADVSGIVHALERERPSQVTYHGILGYPFLSNFIVTINYRERMLTLQESRGPHAAGSATGVSTKRKKPGPIRMKGKPGFLSWRPATTDAEK